jgi:hypothetical protein
MNNFSRIKAKHDFYKKVSQGQLSDNKMKRLTERVSALLLKYSNLLKDKIN